MADSRRVRPGRGGFDSAVQNPTKMKAAKTAPGQSEGGASTSRVPNSPAAASRARAGRRRLVVLLLVGVLLAAAVGLSVVPYRDLRARQARLDAKQQEVALLEQETTRLKAEVRRVESGSDLEVLARKSLNLSLPGEEVFVVTGIPEVVEPAPDATPTKPSPGPVERFVSALRHLF